MKTTPDANEYELARKARLGDSQALGALVEQNRARLFALAYAELRNYADAQDAVASALLSVCVHIRHLRQPERMHAWMNSIVRNEARQLRRSPAPLRLEDFDHELPSPDTLQTVLRDADIAQALQGLSPKQAEAIRLFYFSQLSIREIALRMHHAEGTVKSWLHYGRQRLAIAMKEETMAQSYGLQTASSPPLAELLRTYAAQFDADPLTADRSLLTQTRERLKAELQRLPLSSELAHLAVELHWNWVADASFLVPVLADYLQQPLTTEEEAWARGEYVSSLMALGRNAEVVQQQKAALVWAKSRWEAGQLTSQQLLRVISGSQTEQWNTPSLRADWLALLTDLLTRIRPEADNRMERFYALRTACLMLQADDKHAEALAVTEQIRALADEDTHWDKAYEMRLQADLAAMRVYTVQGDTEALLAAGKRTLPVLQQQWQNVANMTTDARSRLMIQYDNAACSLFFAQQYALCIPLYRHCLELGYSREFGFLCLAAALWAHTGERSEVLALLRQGAARTRSAEDYRALFEKRPEFQDVRNAPDFQSIVDCAGKE